MLLKLRGHTLLTGPASTTISWDTVAAENDQAIQFNLHDDVSRQIALKPKKEITQQDLEWVKENLENAIELQDASTSQRFSLAFNLAHSWNHTQDGRIAIANIWSGLEALFGIQNDRPVTKKLAERIHAWLPTAMTLDEIIELYNHRCDAVHGRRLKAEEFMIAMKSSFGLLQKSLVKCIETKQKTLSDWSGS